MEKIQEMISEAWTLFDDKKYDEARDLYRKCYEEMTADDAATESSILMGLMYVESFSGNYDLARDYANKLLDSASNDDDKHICLHQLGMVERMAENYETALSVFIDEENIIKAAFSDGYDRLSANMYEQGYVNYKMGNLSNATKLMENAVMLGKQSGDAMCLACAYRGMGEILAALDNWTGAKEYFQKSMEEFKQAEDYKGMQEVEEMMYAIENRAEQLKESLD